MFSFSSSDILSIFVDSLFKSTELDVLVNLSRLVLLISLSLFFFIEPDVVRYIYANSENYNFKSWIQNLPVCLRFFISILYLRSSGDGNGTPVLSFRIGEFENRREIELNCIRLPDVEQVAR